MKRFYPSARPETLPDKVFADLADQRFMPPSAGGSGLRIAKTLGMDAEVRTVLERLKSLTSAGKTAVAGRFLPDGGSSVWLAGLGIVENVEEADFSRFKQVVIPYCGISPRQRRGWEEAGHRLVDLTSPQVRRAQVALGLLRMEGAQALVIGRHDDPETRALAGGNPGTKVIEDTTDTARLLFAPAFGAVCQTTLSPRRVSWLVQQLRHRYRDSRVTFLDTTSPAMAVREQALENLLVDCDSVVIVGQPGEASCEALAETSLRRGKTAAIVTGPDDLAAVGSGIIVLTAGAFALDETIRAVAEALMKR